MKKTTINLAMLLAIGCAASSAGAISVAHVSVHASPHVSAPHVSAPAAHIAPPVAHPAPVAAQRTIVRPPVIVPVFPHSATPAAAPASATKKGNSK